MKKVFFVFLSVLAIVLTSCKFENANVTVSVRDTEGAPVANRQVFYTDQASLILSVALPPSPEELLGIEETSAWEHVETNAQGTVSFQVMMGVAKLKYYFIVFDNGSKQWVQKEVTLQRGQNEQIDFEVNK
ncbi:MAG: carboxypeptidase regulatory-like domain-containing protein [Paludibacteraceae bacterium]|nr:carboxypeptidase regulatory-like domain-containing protein [Paludibacteraceae bacterium]